MVPYDNDKYDLRLRQDARRGFRRRELRRAFTHARFPDPISVQFSRSHSGNAALHVLEGPSREQADAEIFALYQLSYRPGGRAGLEPATSSLS